MKVYNIKVYDLLDRQSYKNCQNYPSFFVSKNQNGFVGVIR